MAAKKAVPAPAPLAPALALEGDLDVFSIHGQWELLQPLLASEPGPVALDLSGIGDLDMSGVQLLLALERDLQARGCQLALTGVQEAWKTRYQPLGMAALFDGGRP